VCVNPFTDDAVWAIHKSSRLQQAYEIVVCETRFISPINWPCSFLRLTVYMIDLNCVALYCCNDLMMMMMMML